MYLKRTFGGYALSYESLEEMHDIMDAVVRLRKKFPYGYTVQANGDSLGQEEADQLLKQDAEQVLYLKREAPRLMREALAGLRQSQSGHKFDCGSLQPPLSIFEVGEMQVNRLPSASSELNDQREPSNVSSCVELASEHGVCLNASVTKRDENQEALRQVEKITGSEPVNGEDLLGSEDLKRQLREAKERLKSESGELGEPV
jgi:hypothetical protein